MLAHSLHTQSLHIAIVQRNAKALKTVEYYLYLFVYLFYSCTVGVEYP